MKENMMLQAVDEILKVDLQTLKVELSQLAANLAGTFTTAVEKVTSHATSQVEQALARNSGQAEEAQRLHESERGKVLEHILLLGHNVSIGLDRLESAWLRRSEAEAQETAFQQDKLSPTRGDNLILNSLWKELQQTRAELKASQKWAAQHLLPAGKSTCVMLYGELSLVGLSQQPSYKHSSSASSSAHNSRAILQTAQQLCAACTCREETLNCSQKKRH